MGCELIASTPTSLTELARFALARSIELRREHGHHGCEFVFRR